MSSQSTPQIICLGLREEVAQASFLGFLLNNPKFAQWSVLKSVQGKTVNEHRSRPGGGVQM